MGMTDRQFDAYQQSLLRELRRIKEEIEENSDCAKSKSLEALIKGLEEQLSRP